MEKSFVFNSINGDRRYKAEDFREYFASFVGNGVFPNPSTQLQVLSNNNMTISVVAGKGFINGAIYHNTENLILKIDPADGILNRIDRIVLRFDNLERNITCKVKKGTFASNPISPGLQRDADAYELCIAEIKINKGAVSILQSNITDTRLDSSVCGIVTQTVKTIDTTTLFKKLEAYIDERGKDVDGWLTTFKSERELSFNEWFDTIKGVLDGDVAGNLANRILELENKLKNMKLESTAIDVVDTANNFTEDEHGKKLLEDVLVQINNKAKEAFQGADSGKKIIATAIGSPLIQEDTFADMGNKIERLTNTFKTNLSNKGVDVSGTDKMQGLVEKVNEIKSTRYNIAETNLPKVFEAKTNVNLPSEVTGANYYDKGNYITYFNGKPGYASSSGFYRKRTTIDKDTFEVISNVDSTRYNEYFYNVYVKLKNEDNIAIYEDSRALKFLDIVTHVKENIQIPYVNDYDVGASVCKTDDNRSIYVLGGVYYNTSSSTTKRSGVRKYDPITKTWTNQTNLCTPVAECISIRVGNFIYVFHNGFVDDKVKRIVRYDILTQTSTTLMEGINLTMPKIEGNEEDYFVKDNKIFIAVLEGVYIYDIIKNTIEKFKLDTFYTSFEMRRYFIFSHKGMFYKCGGEQPHYNSSSYDPVVVKEVQMVCTLDD